jgi:hypothetical protein
MKHLLILAALTAAIFTPSAFAADVGVSINIGHPSFYGRIDVGDYPQPRVIYLHPRVVERVARGREPIYLRVPPGYARNWRMHCDEYDACGEPVYFVQDSWYSHEYAPRYREQHHDDEYNQGDRHHNNDESRYHQRDEHSNGDNHDEGDDH